MYAKLKCDNLWVGSDIVTMRDGRYNLIREGAIAVADQKIVWIGPERDSSGICYNNICHTGGGIITPGLIDCHTHLVFGGDRSPEFEQRLTGVSYGEIAAQGGGILSTVRSTRASSQQTLVDDARLRLARLMAEGVTTVEIKSGYGLDQESEIRLLRAIRQLGHEMPIDVHATCLAAHALPPEFTGNPQGWIDLICQRLLPLVVQENLADAVDAFCEKIAFSPQQVSQVFETARALGIPLKIHAEQLSSQRGATLAAQYGALSADHLEYAIEEDVTAMAANGTVAVLLPGAFYLLRETRKPPVELFRRYGVPMALASDANPGTSPVLSLRLMLNMGCTLFGMTPEEALAGVTLNAAKALGCASLTGSLEVGKRADFVVWQVAHPAELVYWLGGELPCMTIYKGEKR